MKCLECRKEVDMAVMDFFCSLDCVREWIKAALQDTYVCQICGNLSDDDDWCENLDCENYSEHCGSNSSCPCLIL